MAVYGSKCTRNISLISFCYCCFRGDDSLVLRVLEGREIRVGSPKCQVQRRIVLFSDREGDM
jgi:hypothetical protein